MAKSGNSEKNKPIVSIKEQKVSVKDKSLRTKEIDLERKRKRAFNEKPTNVAKEKKSS